MCSSAVQPSDQKSAQIRDVVAAYLREMSQQRPCDEQLWIDRHPELMPELAQQMQLARMVHSAEQHKQQSTLNNDGQLTVRCPHCQEVVCIDRNVNWTNVSCHACGSSFGLVGDDAEDADLQPGQFVGRFELVRNLGQGAFGSVWEAVDPQLDRTVALKMPHRGELTATEAELFLREARAAAQIHHPHIVGIHEVGRAGDRIYLVCDFIQGETLADRLARQAFSVREAVGLVKTMARAAAARARTAGRPSRPETGQHLTGRSATALSDRLRAGAAIRRRYDADS